MKIYLTFDYELYFGINSGTPERCLLEPTQLIREATEPFNVKTTQFTDAGYLLRLQQQSAKYPELQKDYISVSQQLTSMSMAGHELQLHIHSHWEDSHFDGSKWVINTKRYRLHQFNTEEIHEIVRRYKKAIQELCPQQPITTFRAGGWCLQPFQQIKNALKEAGIRTDSSIFPGGQYSSEEYFYDFRNAPDKCIWRFEDDPLMQNEEGCFTELPITSIRNNPLFYWKLFLLGRILPSRHKPIGDGIPMSAPGQRKKLLTQTTLQTVSLDGYNAALLNRALREQERKGSKHMVIIGHPKALTRYGASALYNFVKEHHRNHSFVTFNHDQVSS